MRIFLTESIFTGHDVINSLAIDIDESELLIMVTIAKKNNLDLVILHQEEY